jgi:hypothetical protein
MEDNFRSHFLWGDFVLPLRPTGHALLPWGAYKERSVQNGTMRPLSQKKRSQSRIRRLMAKHSRRIDR